jgi:hypothetical protein
MIRRGFATVRIRRYSFGDVTASAAPVEKLKARYSRPSPSVITREKRSALKPKSPTELPSTIASTGPP